MTNPIYRVESSHPGNSIEYVLRERGVSLEQFADETGLSIDDATALVNCEIDMTDELAEIIGGWFGTSAGMWMNMQRGYDNGTIIEVPIVTAEDEVIAGHEYEDVYEVRGSTSKRII